MGTTRTIVYRYGCLPPIENATAIEDQFWRAGRYYNRLVEIERERRRRIETTGARQTKTKEERTALTIPINEWANGERRQARAASGLYWGTYLLVETAIDQAAKTHPRSTMKQNGKIVPRPWWCWPNFRRNDGSGRIGVQIQKGMPTSAVFGADTRLRINPVPETAWTGTRGERRRLTRTVVHLRVGSQGRAPVWASFPMIYHRKMPVEGRIKLAWIGRELIGTRWRYNLCITVDGAPTTPAVAANGRIAVDLGWRVRPDGSIRVGYWANDTGANGEWTIPAEVRDKIKHAHSIESIRKRAFNEFLPRLADWIDATTDIPEWLREATLTIRQWRSPDRLARILWRWSRERFDADVTIWPDVDIYRKQDRHLHDWTDNERDKVIARRQDLFRNWAAWAARNYHHLILENWNMRQVVEKTAEGETQQASAASTIRQFAAPASLRLALINAFTARDGEVNRVPPEYTTQTCAICKVVEAFDAAMSVNHTCKSCGATWDQDHNAALILLARDASGPAPSEDGASDHGDLLTAEPITKRRRWGARAHKVKLAPLLDV